MGQEQDQDQDRTEWLGPRGGPSPADARAGLLAAGTRLGRYRIEALVGRGGMGEVYRAEQLEPVRRTVALKLLRGQTLDARHLAYFEIERQLLAQMRHPAIAQIFDAGTTPEGHPFFAMEFIAGVPITDYCRAHALDLRARLALFIRVCAGVQHAHQKGVVHRDLKPGNLLVDEVDGRPQPKIIDFGIAAARADAGGEVAGTPDYMSPEQAAGDAGAIDTRSDVYALGVVLNELLTGQRPPAAGETVTGRAHSLRLPSEQLTTLPPAQAARLAGELRQPLPRVRRLLRGELDWVVARAMAHDREQRYPSAAALAEDLQRFLDGRPLQAVPPRRRYLLAKFVQRHRLGIGAGAMVAAALLAGLGLSVYGLLQARAQRALAEQRLAQVEQVVAFQQALLEGLDIEAMGAGLAAGVRGQLQALPAPQRDAAARALAGLPAADVARTLIEDHLLASAEQAIARGFAAQPLLAADLRESVARVRQNLGLPQPAAAGFAAVAAARERALGAGDPQALKAREEQAFALLDAAQPEPARHIAEAALARATALAAGDPLRLRLQLARANALAALGERAPARDQLQALLAQARELRGDDDAVTLQIGNDLGILLGRMGEPAAGRRVLEEVLPRRTRLLGAQAPDTLATLHNLAVMRIMTGDAAGALALQRELVAVQTRRLGAEHPLTLGERGNLASMLIDSGQWDAALPIATAVLDARARVLGPEHPQTLRARLNLASLYARLKRFPEALALQREVLEARRRRLGPEHPDTLFIALNLAATLHQAGQSRESLAQLAQAMPVAERVLGAHHPQVLMGHDIRAQDAAALGDRALERAALQRLLAGAEAAAGAADARTVEAAWRLERVLRAEHAIAAADAVHARYVAPLLRADPAALDAARAALRQRIQEAPARTAG